MINVTKTYLPPLEEYNNYLKKIWENNHVTNFGPLSIELEEKLKKYLDVKHLFFVTNGTIALQIAIKALNLKDEVITTPFSYVATTSSIVWEGCEPIFADIDPETLTIDPAEIEKKITQKTTGILATHVYGNPCDIKKIEEMAKKNNLKVIYDAAHAFGVKHNDKSIFNYGDISIASFHATKLFHTIEGGALITNNDALAHKISYMRNFGHKGYEEFWGLGINGKNSEFHAAMGLAVLTKIEELINIRKILSKGYDELLNWDILLKPQKPAENNYNYAYYPIILPTEESLLAVKDALNKADISPRRYFYPSLNTINYIKNIIIQEMPVAEEISKKILCLPLAHDLSPKDIKKISKIINSKVI